MRRPAYQRYRPLRVTSEELNSYVRDRLRATLEHRGRVSDFLLGRWTSKSTLLRHMTEIANRIPLMIETDAHAVAISGRRDPALASSFCRYLADEFGHEKLFVTDLETFGLTENKIVATQPFPSTIALIELLKVAPHRHGLAPAAISSWCYEVYASTYSSKILAKAIETFGADHFRGWLSHTRIDADEHHEDFMNGLVEGAIATFVSDEIARGYVDQIVDWMKDYFAALMEATVDSADHGAATS